MVVPCALGRAGSRVVKREGDGATPIGRWRVGEVFYRMDRLRRPRTQLPVRPLRRLDGWCDAVGDRNYNRPVRHPYAASAEKLWRSDSLYDLILTLNHNTRPRVQGHGSAIFLHVAGPGYPTTAACIFCRCSNTATATASSASWSRRAKSAQRRPPGAFEHVPGSCVLGASSGSRWSAGPAAKPEPR